MTERQERDAVEVAKESLAAAESARASDEGILSMADDVIGRLRSTRIENHWTDKIRAQIRGAA